MDVQTVVEVNITANEIVEAITEQDHERIGVVCQGLNGCAQWLKAIPDTIIAEMKDGQREVVAKFLREQAERYVPNAELSDRASKT